MSFSCSVPAFTMLGMSSKWQKKVSLGVTTMNTRPLRVVKKSFMSKIVIVNTCFYVQYFFAK